MMDEHYALSKREHLQYHLQVSLTGCGVPDCDFGKALVLHFQALETLEKVGEDERG